MENQCHWSCFCFLSLFKGDPCITALSPSHAHHMAEAMFVPVMGTPNHSTPRFKGRTSLSAVSMNLEGEFPRERGMEAISVVILRDEPGPGFNLIVGCRQCRFYRQCPVFAEITFAGNAIDVGSIGNGLYIPLLTTCNLIEFRPQL